MKKLTAIILALVIALSVAVTAFAASTYQCPYCLEVIEGEKAYNVHLDKKCPEVGNDIKKEEAKEEAVATPCPYGCGAEFMIEAEYEKHLGICDKKTDPTFAEKVEDFIVNFTFDDAIGAVEELLAKVDFPGLLVKVIDLLEKAVTAIIGAI
ncbi:MAG: hypothetical protein IJE72_00070 [Clostridia bacterium]|nr:hypothetical protein [Clostridia bacterium]